MAMVAHVALKQFDHNAAPKKTSKIFTSLLTECENRVPFIAMTTIAAKQKTELDQLKVVLAMRGWSGVQLAKATGISYGHLRNVLCGRRFSSAGRSAINAALGREILTVQPEQSNVPRERRRNGSKPSKPIKL
jgi:hypothetical protein